MSINQNNSQLNSSPTKQKYSFSKEKRFSPYKANTDVSYLPAFQHDRRSALIGYGERSMLADKNKAKYPHTYDVPPMLEYKKGNSFKSGRHAVGGPFYLRQEKQVPGPEYDIPLKNQSKGPTMRARHQDTTIVKRKYIPGPGSYDLPSSIEAGKKSNVESKFTSSGSARIGPKQYGSAELRSPRYEKKEVPGPGQYETLKYSLANSDNILGQLSKVKFGKQKRSELVKKESLHIPGPGQQY